MRAKTIGFCYYEYNGQLPICDSEINREES